MRAVALTFDNLGDSADRARGDAVDGTHPSLTVLPWLLDALDERGLRATFFVEGVNAVEHPRAVLSIAERGHEIGCHAYRHERWSELTGAAEVDVLDRSLAALRGLGLDVTGFRPPGGAVHAGTPELLRARGVEWCSPEGADAHRRPDGLVVLPFAWPMVDAYHRMEPFAALREAHGDPGPALDPAETAARLEAELARVAAPTCLILHPVLAGDPDGAASTLRVLDAVRRLDAEVGPGRELAARV